MSSLPACQPENSEQQQLSALGVLQQLEQVIQVMTPAEWYGGQIPGPQAPGLTRAAADSIGIAVLRNCAPQILHLAKVAVWLGTPAADRAMSIDRNMALADLEDAVQDLIGRLRAALKPAPSLSPA